MSFLATRHLASRKASHSRHSSRRGISLLEIVVSIAIIGMLLGLLVPAVQQSREAGRRIACANNLKQLATATQLYESNHGSFPMGNSDGRSAFVALLPFMDRAALFRESNTISPFPNPFSLSGTSPTIYQTSLPVFSCISDSATGTTQAMAGTSYAMNWGSGVQKYGYNGLFRPLIPDPILPNGLVRPADVRDGLSNTAMFAEILQSNGQLDRVRTVWNLPTAMPLPAQYEAFSNTCRDLSVVTGGLSDVRGRPWAHGDVFRTAYTHMIEPNRPSCTNGGVVPMGSYSAGSAHSNGAQVAFADGHIDFVSNQVSLSVWRAFGSRSGSD